MDRQLVKVRKYRVGETVGPRSVPSSRGRTEMDVVEKIIGGSVDRCASGPVGTARLKPAFHDTVTDSPDTPTTSLRPTRAAAISSRDDVGVVECGLIATRTSRGESPIVERSIRRRRQTTTHN